MSCGSFSRYRLRLQRGEIVKVKAVKTFVCGRYYVKAGETADISTDSARTVLRMGLAEPAEKSEVSTEKPEVSAEKLTGQEKKPAKAKK